MANEKYSPENRICPNKLEGNEWGCMGYMNEIRPSVESLVFDGTPFAIILKCPLCGYSVIKNEFRIEGN